MATKTMNFKIGDKVRIENSWITEKVVGTIDKFQKNGRIEFVRLKLSAELADKYGVLFPLDELRKYNG